MKNLISKLLVALLICALMFTAVGCELLDQFKEDLGIGDNGGADGKEEPDDKVETPNKDALNAEIALEVTEQGDYTLDSYNAYAAKLAEAKAIANDTAATQESIDKATADLTAARLALAIRPVKAVDGANKEINLISGNIKEVSLADFVNINGLSKITYKIQASNEVVTLSDITDGKFTVTAGDVSEATTVKVSINVYYDNVAKLAVELSVKITNDVAPTLKNKEVVNECDLFELENKESIVLDFAENVNNGSNLELTYSAKCDNEELVLNGSSYTVTFGTYTDEVVYKTFNVTVTCMVNGQQTTLQYTYKLALKDTSAYRVANGNFENGLSNWTASDESFGAIDDRSTFWGQNFPMFNVGKYFSSESSDKGSLASPYFKVNSNYATYMLGAAGKEKVYITIEDADGKVLALYRNTKFADLPSGYTDAEYHEMIGNTVFVCNFVTYKVDISAYEGQSIRFVIHDLEDGNGGFGFVLFDELNTYYASEDAVPENAVLAENLLANKTALNEELALEVTEQGDYTLDSFNAYRAKFDEAKALVNDIAATQEAVDAVTSALADARAALTVRPITEVEGANKKFSLISGNSKEIILADYINVNGLSNITYAVEANNTIATLSSIADGKFTVTAGVVDEATTVKVSIIVSYNGTEKLTVELSVEITNDVAPTLKSEEVVKEYDIYALENKTNITIDLSENIENAGNLELSYSVAGNDLSDSLYTFTFGSYTDEVTYESIMVTVSYTANGNAGTLEYTYKLGLKDTTAYRLTNGDFENGIEGWTQVGNIGGVSSDGTYWNEGIEFGMDGKKMFSAYAPGALESAVGTLTSSTFKVGGSGFVTFKVGAMRDQNYVYVDVVDAETKQILARYYNGLWSGADLGGCKLIAYKADLSAFDGKEVFFRISDNADSGYGLFFADSFITYYENEPEGFNAATPVGYEVSGTIYDVFNGGFEMGDNQGWWNNGEIGVVTNANGYWADNIPYGKVGDYLFTGVESFGADTMREGNTGALTSSVFEIGGTGWISFMLGGGSNECCYIQVIDAVTGEILARYHQQAQQDAKLIQYVADLSAYIGRTARIQVVDQANSGWGCVSFDNVVTYYPTGVALPEGITANDIKYQIVNGGFETGNLGGWQNDGEIGVVTNANGYWGDNISYNKVGEYLFTGVESFEADTMREGNTGTLTSSAFVIGGSGYISFKLGGGENELCYIQIIDVVTGEVLAKYHQQAMENATLKQYVADLSAYIGKTVKIQIVDQAISGWGCVSFDNVITYYASTDSLPTDAITANDIK